MKRVFIALLCLMFIAAVFTIGCEKKAEAPKPAMPEVQPAPAPAPTPAPAPPAPAPVPKPAKPAKK